MKELNKSNETTVNSEDQKVIQEINRLAILKNRCDSRTDNQNLRLMSKSLHWEDAKEVIRESGQNTEAKDIAKISSIIFHSRKSGVALGVITNALSSLLEFCKNDPISTRKVLDALDNASWHPNLLNSALNELMLAKSKDIGAVRLAAEELIRTTTTISIISKSNKVKLM